MINVELSARELTYLLLSLRKYEQGLMAQEEEEMEDTATDLIFIQSLSKKLVAAKEAK
ncbi:hypothetical protein [Dyella acidisoli]|uniref:Uncharacterized protein n=1 Tax=Dyella acidisoli TaxID=1867834 RepID=A0ABQ5XK07_9GAMM|nr:hypothetical protein [Dyella acidisoli]GLQ91531.1 hypothetical protein GCM10007901_04810 [Dyella acidisoli]